MLGILSKLFKKKKPETTITYNSGTMSNPIIYTAGSSYTAGSGGSSQSCSGSNTIVGNNVINYCATGGCGGSWNHNTIIGIDQHFIDSMIHELDGLEKLNLTTPKETYGWDFIQ